MDFVISQRFKLFPFLHKVLSFLTSSFFQLFSLFIFFSYCIIDLSFKTVESLTKTKIIELSRSKKQKNNLILILILNLAKSCLT